MPDTAATADAAAALLAAAADQGPGDTLRIVLLASIVGGVLLAWFLLRGYRTDGTDDAGGGNGAAGAAVTAKPGATDGVSRGDAAAGTDTAAGDAAAGTDTAARTDANAGAGGNTERDANA
ncbi:hypothetical protein ACFUJU_00695 [Streptomyces sp. NPDC057235]|uniref:hypothetical protein n=1 Tax=Streptomyces sp. NPDC057235 TaxID=3346058 RepID=UPI00363B161D